MMKTELIYGIAAGLGISLWVFIEFLLGLHDKHLEIGQFTGYLSTIIPIACIYLGLKEKRGQLSPETLTLQQGLTTGLIVSLISGIITTAFFLLYYHFINPGWRQSAEDFERSQWEHTGMPEEEIALQIEQLKFLNSDTGVVIFNMISSLVLGMIISFFLTLFLRKKEGI